MTKSSSARIARPRRARATLALALTAASLASMVGASAPAASAAETVPAPALEYTFDQIDARPAGGALLAEQLVPHTSHVTQL